jgi:hypothetical protein
MKGHTRSFCIAINFEQMEKVARTIMATGWTLANAAKRPTVDKPLPASVTGN